MYAAPGIGLAATQVDVHEQIIVIDVSEEKNQLQVFINPEILEKSSDILRGEEGCLSVPGFFEEVPRSSRVKVRYMDENEVVHILDAEGILAVCLQHETDHLKGKLFVDYLSPLKRSRLLHKIKKQQREAAKNR
jgi:peptide deformylase